MRKLILILAVAIGFLTTSCRQSTVDYKSKVGEKVVIDDDTLTVINYDYADLILSDGRTVDHRYPIIDEDHGEY